MVEQYKFFFVTTAVLCTIALAGYWGSWGGWVTSTLMVVDKRTEVMSGKLDDTHTMLALIIEKMTPQKASAPQNILKEAEIRASLGQ